LIFAKCRRKSKKSCVLPESLPASLGFNRHTLARRPICDSVTCCLDGRVILFPAHVAMVCRSRPASVLRCLQGLHQFCLTKVFTVYSAHHRTGNGYSGFRVSEQAAHWFRRAVPALLWSVAPSGRCAPNVTLPTRFAFAQSSLHRCFVIFCNVCKVIQLKLRFQGTIVATYCYVPLVFCTWTVYFT
jgi:hypothetical protein